MEVRIFDLGLVDFKSAWDFQHQVFAQVKSGEFNFALITCRHHPVITLGRSAKKGNILASCEELRRRNVEIFEIERGGDATFHYPGQLTLYPVFNLAYLKKDIHWFLRELEEVIIDSCVDCGCFLQRKSGLTGVWSGERKIASIGIAIRHWITFHGVSLNIKPHGLEGFNLIRPCGMNIEMTTLEEILGRSIEVDEVKNNLIEKMKGACYDKSNVAGVR
ncbi:MAG: lipoyl(octanoyl) transferase LipB [Candidatus Omnitrophica bacterium]|nr:lipoyl(octanoyl) transferase LipB [Candidatus Omnitrophota bacterium]MDD5653023.1 lipoyl(octanoyl) transferase LipB [Candidatus Omnitrophota bacterium]